jgi:hypothetical protein
MADGAGNKIGIPEWVKARVGTSKWVVASRLTPRLQGRGYTLAITPKRYAVMMREYKAVRALRTETAR